MCCDRKLPAILSTRASVLYSRCYPPLSKLAAHTANRYDTKYLTQQNTEYRKKERNMRMSTNCGASHIATHPSPPGPPSLAIALITKLYVLIISFHQRKKGFSGSCSSHIFIFRRAGAGGASAQGKQWKIYRFLIKREGTVRALSPSRAERASVKRRNVYRSTKAHKLIESSLPSSSLPRSPPPARSPTPEGNVFGMCHLSKVERTKETAREIDWLDGARRRFREIGPGKAQMIINFTIGGNKG